MVPQPRLSPEFLASLNKLSQFSDTAFGDGSQIHVEYRVSLDETAKIPYELDVDGRQISFTGKPTQPVQLSWPSSVPGANLIVKSEMSKGRILHIFPRKRKETFNVPIKTDGLWGLFRILQNAENPSPGLFTFSHLNLRDQDASLEEGTHPFMLQIRVESSAGNLFSRRYFSGFHCTARAIQ
jgi:type VI protein secretion system component VasK